jgi:energy-coupling factor transporter transmembrane protein EcfT
MTICTTTQLILLFIFALILNSLTLGMMLLIMLVLLILLVYQENKQFYRLMKRLKWFFLVMFAIFLFNTPGEHITTWSFNLNPTYEGLEIGLNQIMRISLVLALLSIVLTKNTKQQLISGLYYLMLPLSFFGLDTQRFSARLWLTLHYVELDQMDTKKVTQSNNLAERLDKVFTENAFDDDTAFITLESPIFTWVDYSVILCMLSLLLLNFLS